MNNLPFDKSPPATPGQVWFHLRPAARAQLTGWVLVALAVIVVIGPFLWILMNSFKSQIAILSGAWVFTPTLDSYRDVLFSRRSDFLNGLSTSLVVASISTLIVLIIAINLVGDQLRDQINPRLKR